MEARNAIFRNALVSLHKLFPETDEEKLSKSVAEKMPSHFNANGAKRSIDSTAEPPFRRKVQNLTDLTAEPPFKREERQQACHGFPLHLPGHVEPCRDNVNIQCNEMDNKIRRLVAFAIIFSLGYLVTMD